MGAATDPEAAAHAVLSFRRRLLNILLLGAGWCCTVSALFIQASRRCFETGGGRCGGRCELGAGARPLPLLPSPRCPAPPRAAPHQQHPAPQISNTSIAAGSIPGGGPSLQTVPVAVFTIAAAASVLPLALVMRAWGRRPVVFAAGALGLVGAGLELLAMRRGGFALLTVGALLQVRRPGRGVCGRSGVPSGTLPSSRRAARPAEHPRLVFCSPLLTAGPQLQPRQQLPVHRG
jgi:hypothetical protein